MSKEFPPYTYCEDCSYNWQRDDQPCCCEFSTDKDGHELCEMHRDARRILTEMDEPVS